MMDQITVLSPLACSIDKGIPFQPRLISACQHLFGEAALLQWFRTCDRVALQNRRPHQPYLCPCCHKIVLEIVEIPAITAIATAYHQGLALSKNLSDYEPKKMSEKYFHRLTVALKDRARPSSIEKRGKRLDSWMSSHSLLELEDAVRVYAERCFTSGSLQQRLHFLRTCYEGPAIGAQKARNSLLQALHNIKADRSGLGAME